MRYTLLALCGLALSAHATPPTAPAAEPTAEVKTSRAVVKQFASTLLTALQQAIDQGGPVEGIAICQKQSGAIAEKVSAEHGMLIGRTSLKVRNPQNAPDAWELAVLKQFAARKAQGEAVEKLEFSAVIPDDQGKETFRYMKAIPTGKLCLTCHGAQIPEAVDAKLKELYPEDKARGFQEGDVRGAFTIAKPLP